jgi:hypothetical protein
VTGRRRSCWEYSGFGRGVKGYRLGGRDNLQCMGKASKEVLKKATRKFKQGLRQFVNELKVKPCKDCGRTFPPVCMEFDHIGEDKIHSVSGMVARHWSKEDILKEVAKCDLVCVLCHRLRTFSREQHKTTEDLSTDPVLVRQRKKRHEGIAYLTKYKEERPCADCGGFFKGVQMDFDHRPGTVKVASVGKLINSPGALALEMAKCELVCVRCHRLRTEKEGAHQRRSVRGEPLLVDYMEQKGQDRLDRNDRIEELYKVKNLCEVAEAVGVTSTCVRDVLMSRGVEIRDIAEVRGAQRFLSSAEDRQLADLYRYGFTGFDLMEMYSLGGVVVYQSLDRSGVKRRCFTRSVEANGVVYRSQYDAAKKLGIPRTTISANLRGKLKTANGLVFKYVEASNG